MIVDCNPEFGCELALALPYAYWLHERGELEKVVTTQGMKPFYYFCDNVEEKYNHRTIDNNAANMQSLPNPWIYGTQLDAKLHKGEWEHWESFYNAPNGIGILNYEKWKMPNFSEQYKNDEFVFDKPFIVIANRYNWEHGQPPVGYFSLPCLYEMFTYLTNQGYKVIYKRPRNNEFPLDQNEMNTVNNRENLVAEVEGGGLISDYDLTTHFEDVMLIDDVVSNNPNLTYNEVQLSLFANADKFIGISGGSTLVLNLFQKPTITYLYNKSDLREKFWEDENGNKNIKNYYYMMNPNVIPYIDVECEDMRQNKFDNFLNLVKETIK